MTTLIPADTCAPPVTLRESITRNERIEGLLKEALPYLERMTPYFSWELFELIEAVKKETA